ncbi:hypothetical protein BAE44_0024065 [Dichanthelium oligosanthes]|uniref:Uncharacterized protein n=1 Tax=Dichanthelium oligosanthes TaxID=888268 RepID=A0A1E5UPT4_9POAL|nr:hypothetical protein BAE44_0024065 [Dichanthelium oligosanthes]
MVKVKKKNQHIFQRRPKVYIEKKNCYCLPIISHASEQKKKSRNPN